MMKDNRRKQGIKKTVPIIQVYMDGSKTFKIFDGSLVITVFRPHIKNNKAVVAVLKKLGYVLNGGWIKTEYGWECDLYDIK